MISVGECFLITVTYAVSFGLSFVYYVEIVLILGRGCRFTNRIVRVGRYSN